MTPAHVHRDLRLPATLSIGERTETNGHDASGGHRASSVATRLLVLRLGPRAVAAAPE